MSGVLEYRRRATQAHNGQARAIALDTILWCMEKTWGSLQKRRPGDVA